MSDYDPTTYKVCKCCQQAKPLSSFGPFKKSRDRLNYYCKPCHAARSKSWVTANKDAAAAKQKKYREKDKAIGVEAAYRKAYYAKNREVLRAKQKDAYYQRTEDQKERIRQINREYLARNSSAIYARRRATKLTQKQMERRRELARSWYKKNQQRVIIDKLAKSHHRRVLLAAAGGVAFTRKDIERIYVLQKGCCAFCRKRLKKYHVDHRMPVSKGGDNTSGNIEILCPSCNLRKSNKLPHVFAQENGKLI